jgi:hypothetical protein
VRRQQAPRIINGDRLAASRYDDQEDENGERVLLLVVMPLLFMCASAH